MKGSAFFRGFFVAVAVLLGVETVLALIFGDMNAFRWTGIWFVVCCILASREMDALRSRR